MMPSELSDLRSRGKRLRSIAKDNGHASKADGKAVDSASRYADRDSFGSFGLTRRQAMYVLEYIADPSSQTAAAVRAGYSPQSAHQAATGLMKSGKVKAAIEVLQERMRENTAITAEAVLTRLSEIAFDTRPKPRSADQVRALELMSKWLGLEVQGNTQLQVVVRFEDEVGDYVSDDFIEDAVLLDED